MPRGARQRIAPPAWLFVWSLRKAFRLNPKISLRLRPASASSWNPTKKRLAKEVNCAKLLINLLQKISRAASVAALAKTKPWLTGESLNIFNGLLRVPVKKKFRH